MLIYTYCLDDIKEAVQCPGKSTLIGICNYLSIGIPCALIQSSDMMVVQSMTFIAGYFGIAAQNAHLILASFGGIIFMAGTGIWQAVATIVGH